MESNEQQLVERQVSRRNMLKAAGIGGGIAMVSFAQLFAGAEHTFAAPRKGTAHDKMDPVQTVLNLAATAETLAATGYFSVLTGGTFLGRISNQGARALKLAGDSEVYHLSLLESLGGKALVNEFYVPANFLTDFNVFISTLIAAETAFTGAFLAATRRMAELGEPRLAVTTAQFAATEQEHLAITRMVAGFDINPSALAAPIYYNVSDAAPTLTPFLTGGPGFIGPVPFPGKDRVRTAFMESVKVPPFISLF